MENWTDAWSYNHHMAGELWDISLVTSLEGNIAHVVFYKCVLHMMGRYLEGGFLRCSSSLKPSHTTHKTANYAVILQTTQVFFHNSIKFFS